MDPAAYVRSHGVTLMIGRTTIAPADFAPPSVLQEVERFNASTRLVGLPDELQPELLDPAKVAAFLQALPQLDAASTARIARQTLRLNMPGMRQLGAASAALPGAGMQLQALERNDNPGLAPVRLAAPIDADAARARIKLARQAVEERDLKLGAGQPQVPAGPDKGLLQQQRRAAAMAWAELAGQLARVPGAAAEASREGDLARKALAASSVAPAAGRMPSR